MIQLVTNNLYRGPRPKSHEDLKPFNIGVVVDLQSGAYEKITNTKYEYEDPGDFLMTHINMFCGDMWPPSAPEVDRFMKIVLNAQHWGVNVYVHCLHGKDRTGFMCAVYRMIICKWSFKEAVKEMFSFKFHKFPYIFWLLWLRKYKNMATITDKE